MEETSRPRSFQNRTNRENFELVSKLLLIESSRIRVAWVTFQLRASIPFGIALRAIIACGRTGWLEDFSIAWEAHISNRSTTFSIVLIAGTVSYYIVSPVYGHWVSLTSDSWGRKRRHRRTYIEFEGIGWVPWILESFVLSSLPKWFLARRYDAISSVTKIPCGFYHGRNLLTLKITCSFQISMLR